MPVPSPSIKPSLVAGGVHRAIYMGQVGVSTNASPADYALGVVRLRNQVGEQLGLPPDGTQFTGPNGLTFTWLGDSEQDGFDWLLVVRADQTGPQYNLAQGTQLSMQLSPEGTAVYGSTVTAEYAFFGGANETAAEGLLHIDLTAFSPAIRSASYFADQLTVWIHPLDEGISDVQPQVIRKEDLHGVPVPEYLTLNVTNDQDANQWVVVVDAPHSHHR